jgi:hypothetical protein
MVHSYFFFKNLEGAILIGPSPFFWEHWALPNRSTSLDHQLQIKTNVLPMAHLFSIYTWKLNFGQTVWDKSEVLLGTFWGTTWKPGAPCANPMETHRKPDGNKERKQKIPSPSLCAWNFYFQNYLSPFFV